MPSIPSVLRHRCVTLLLAAACAAPLSLHPQIPSSNPPSDVVIQNATVMTVTHGTIPHGSVWIHNGKIAGVGSTVNAPAGAKTIDAAGKFVTPGIIDPHSHSALGDDINEATSPVTPSMMMIDAFDNLEA
jgi:imidazolonepropionase-like amidohydrolase